MSNRRNSGQAAIDIVALHHGEPIIHRRRIGGIDRIAVVGRGIANAAAHAAGIAIGAPDAGLAIVRLSPPDSQREGIVDIGRARGRLNRLAGADHRTTQAAKDRIDGRRRQRWRANHAVTARMAGGWPLVPQAKRGDAPTNQQDGQAQHQDAKNLLLYRSFSHIGTLYHEHVIMYRVRRF